MMEKQVKIHLLETLMEVVETRLGKEKHKLQMKIQNRVFNLQWKMVKKS